MLDETYEVLAHKREQLKKQIEELKKSDTEKIRGYWNKKEFHPFKATTGAEDGSYNFIKYKSFVLYAVNAAAFCHDGKILEKRLSDINILRPYKYLEERLRLYMGIFELKASYNLIEKCDLFLIDGSLIGNIIRPPAFENFLNSQEKKDLVNKFIPELESNLYKKPVYSTELYDMIDNSKKEEGIAYLEYLEYLLSLKNLLERGSKKLVGISKFSTSTERLKLGNPDITLFEGETISSGYSEPLILEIGDKLKRKFPTGYLDTFFRRLSFTVTDVRFEEKKFVYRIEIPRKVDTEEIENIMSNIKSSCADGYPYLLHRAHKAVEIKKKEMERIARSLGITAKSGREMLKW